MLNDENFNQGVILGQKYAYATASLLLGIICYIQLLGMERAILAIIFAILALRSVPQPRLEKRRLWAIAGLILGIITFILVPAIIIFKFDQVKELIHALNNLQ
jgi:hypothetical protein